MSLLIVAILVTPGLVNWNPHKQRLATQVGALVGRAVEIEGDVDFALLPTPTLSAGQVRMAGGGDGTGPLLEIGSLDARVAFLPLLVGTVQVEQVALVDPVMILETRADGSLAWTEDVASDRRAIQFDRVTVRNGTVIWRRADATERRVDDIFAQFATSGPGEPFELVASLAVDTVPLTVDMSAGRVTSAGALPITVRVGADGVDGEATLAGLVTPGFGFQGDVTAEGSDLGAVFARLWPSAPAALLTDEPFAVRASAVVVADSIDLNGVTATVGEVNATGAISMVPGPQPRMDVALSVNRVDLGPLLGDDLFARSDSATTEGVSSLLDGLTVTLDLAVDAATLRDGLIRQVRLTGGIDAGVLTVEGLSAQLPGGSAIVLGGTAAMQDGVPAFAFDAEATSNDLRGFLEWLGYPLDAVPSGGLRRFGGTASLTGTSRQFQLTGVDATIDNTRLTGGLAYLDRGRPGFGLRLAVDRLNLDSYWPGGVPALSLEAVSNGAGLGILAGLLQTFDANIEATVGALTVSGASLRDLALDATVNGGRITLRQAVADGTDGQSARLSGILSNLDPVEGMDLDIDLTGVASAPVLRLLGLAPLVPDDVVGSVDVRGRLQGGVARLELELEAGVAGGTVALGGAVMRANGVPAYDLAVRARHDQADAVAALLWPGYRPAGPIGALDLYAQVAGLPQDLSLSGISGTIGPVAVGGAVRWRDDGRSRPSVVADLRLGDLPMDRFLSRDARRLVRPGPTRWSDTPFDLDWLTAADARLALVGGSVSLHGIELRDAVTTLTLTDGAAVLDRLTAQAFGGTVEARGRLSGGARPEMALAIDLVGADLTPVLDRALGLSGVDGTLDVGVDLAAQGVSLAEMTANMAGAGLIGVRDGVLADIDLDRMANLIDTARQPVSLRPPMTDGQTPFAALNATFRVAGGVAETDDVRIVADQGVGEGEGTVDLADWQIDLATGFRLHRLSDAPPFGIALTGSLDRPRRGLTLEALQDYLTDVLAARAGREAPAEAPAEDTMEDQPGG